MATVFFVEGRGRSQRWRVGDLFANNRTLTRVVLGDRDWRIMQLLFENKIVSREQIGNRFFPNVCKDTVNRRLRKIVGLGLIKKTTAYVGRKAISGYSLTLNGLDKIKPTLPYEIKTKATRSECPLHDIALNDIRKAFETKATVQSYYTENILQARIDFKNDEWFKPFVELNSDAMVAVDSKVGTLHLAIEFDLTHKSHRRYQRKLNAYYREDKIDGVLYVCADEYILQTLHKLDNKAAERHACDHKLYLAMFADVTGAEKEMTFTNAGRDIFRVR